MSLLTLGRATRVPLTSAPSYILISVDNSVLTVARGGTTQAVVTLQRFNYNKPVALSILPDLPTDVTVAWDYDVLMGSQLVATATFTAGASAPAASTFGFTFYAFGSSGVEAVVAATMDVTIPVVTSISATISPPSQNVVQGSTAVFQIALTRINGYAGVVTPVASNLPTDVSVSFSPTTFTGPTATVTATATALGGAPLAGAALFDVTLSGSGVSPVLVQASLAVVAASATPPMLFDDMTGYADTAALRAAITAKTIYSVASNANTLISLDDTVLFNGRKTMKFSYPAGNVLAKFQAFNANAGAISVANNTISVPGHPFSTADAVIYDQDYQGTPPAPIVQLGTYYIIKVDANTVKLAATASDATNNIPIDFTTAGAGTRPSLSAITNGSETGSGTQYPLLEMNFPAGQNALYNIWFRKRMRWAPGFSCQGNAVNVQVLSGNRFASAAQSLKHYGFGMTGANGRCIGIVAGTTMQREWNVNSWPGGNPPGSFINVSGAGRNMTPEWNSGLWYDYIQHSYRVNSQSVRYRHWMCIVGQPKTLLFDATYTCVAPQTIPAMNRALMTQNYNQYRELGKAYSFNIAEWEVINGAVTPDPYGLGSGA